MSTSPDDPSPLASFLNKHQLKDSEGQQAKVILSDECGDTLWDEVLAQDDATGKIRSETKESPNP